MIQGSERAGRSAIGPQLLNMTISQKPSAMSSLREKRRANQAKLMHARYFATSSQRFMMVDPLPANNLYSYVKGNPTNFRDPKGLMRAILDGCLACGAVRNPSAGGAAPQSWAKTHGGGGFGGTAYRKVTYTYEDTDGDGFLEQHISFSSIDANGAFDLLAGQGKIEPGDVETLEPSFKEQVKGIMIDLALNGWIPTVPKESGRRSAAFNKQTIKNKTGVKGSKHLTGMAADIVDVRYGWSAFSSNGVMKAYISDLISAAHANGLESGAHVSRGGDWWSKDDWAHVESPTMSYSWMWRMTTRIVDVQGYRP